MRILEEAEQEVFTTENKIDCWNRIGVWGDKRPRCSKLTTALHCRNCEIFAFAGRGMLDRGVPEGYLDEWSDVLNKQKTQHVAAYESMLVFRLGDEWIAIPTKFVKEITQMGAIHRLPHRDQNLIKGLANVRGELKICISLGMLLQLKRGAGKKKANTQGIYERIVVAVHKDTEFVFPVSQVEGLLRYHNSQLENVPATIINAKAAFSLGMLTTPEKHIACLNHDLLFEALDKKLV
jgi:chemotaxis-related protein WspD